MLQDPQFFFPKLLMVLVLVLIVLVGVAFIWLTKIQPFIMEIPEKAESKIFRTPQYIVRIRNMADSIEESFGLTVSSIDNSGKVKIQPRQSKKWRREGLEQELSNFIGIPLRITFQNEGLVTLTATKRVAIPSVLAGRARFEQHKDLILGVNVRTGDEARITVAENSAIVVAGKPGCGKTILLKKLVSAFSEAGHRTVTWDGKIDSLAEFDGLLDAAQDVMQQRLEDGIDAWKNDEEKILVIVLDEVQTALTNAFSKDEKEAQNKRIIRLRDLILRGRSAGVLIVLATQKPSAEAIPTAIRDNAGVRICGQVAAQHITEMALGRIPEAFEPDPTKITATGRFVVSDGRGEWQEIQAFC